MTTVKTGVSPQQATHLYKNQQAKTRSAESTDAPRTTGASGTTATQSSPSNQPAAAVQVSSKAKELAQTHKALQQAVKESPDVREDKVAQIQQQIAAGKYQPSAQKIAEGIVREAIRDELAQSPQELVT